MEKIQILCEFEFEEDFPGREVLNSLLQPSSQVPGGLMLRLAPLYPKSSAVMWRVLGTTKLLEVTDGQNHD